MPSIAYGPYFRVNPSQWRAQTGEGDKKGVQYAPFTLSILYEKMKGGGTWAPRVKTRDSVSSSLGFVPAHICYLLPPFGPLERERLLLRLYEREREERESKDLERLERDDEDEDLPRRRPPERLRLQNVAVRCVCHHHGHPHMPRNK